MLINKNKSRVIDLERAHALGGNETWMSWMVEHDTRYRTQKIVKVECIIPQKNHCYLLYFWFLKYLYHIYFFENSYNKHISLYIQNKSPKLKNVYFRQKYSLHSRKIL